MATSNHAAAPDPDRRAPAAPDGSIPEFTLGDRLRKAREFAGIDMRDLAQMIDIHRQSVARYEQGQAIPRRPVMLSWAISTGVSLEWITSGEISTHDEKSERTTDYSFQRDYSLEDRGITRISWQTEDEND